MPPCGTEPGPDVERGAPAVKEPALRRQTVVVVFFLSCLLCVLVVAGLGIGTRAIPPRDVFDALFGYDGSQHDVIVRELRVPRTVLGLLVGAALGMAGAVMQGLTRNPLADPGLLGVSGGAALAVVIAMAFFGITEPSGYLWWAFAGAGLAGAVVYGLGSAGRAAATPTRLALAGAAVTLLLWSGTNTVLLLDEATADQFRFWWAGSLAGRDLSMIATVAPLVALGGGLGLACARGLDSLGLGDDMARLRALTSWPSRYRTSSPPCC